MNVTRAQIIRRGLANRCPNCGERTLFPPRSFRVHRRCPSCGTGFDRGEGFFLGPFVLNYTVCVFFFVLPAILLGSAGVIPWGVALVLAGLGCLVLPALLYRRMWSAWLMLYFYFIPQRLPANGGATGAEEED
jgi:uncharacterized protein (DUF983 family)